MRKLLQVFVFVTVGVVSTLSQSAPDGAELTRMLNEFLAGAGRNDAAVHDRFWADDLIYTRSTGARTNKEELMKGVRSAPAPKAGDPLTVYTAEDIKIHQYGDVAVVAFRLVINTTNADGSKTTGNNLNTGTFIKRSGRWQVVAWQSTVITKPATSEPKPATSSAAATSPAAKTDKVAAPQRVYQKGPRGGCYYVNSTGTKVYVDHSFCK